MFFCRQLHVLLSMVAAAAAVLSICVDAVKIYFALLPCIEHCFTNIKFTLYIYIYIYIYSKKCTMQQMVL